MNSLDMNAIGEDTAKGDPEAPAGLLPLAISSAGKNLYGIIYLAEGQGPHPTAMFLHGFPGNDRMLDIGQSLRRAGLNSVFFAYRGAWGSEGDFSYANCIDDAEAVVEFLRDPPIAAKYRIDPAGIIVVGHSMGGFVAFSLARRRPELKRVMFLSGWNLGQYGQRLAAGDAEYKERVLAALGVSAVPLKGTSAVKLRDEILSLKDSHDLLKYVPELGGRKIFMIGAGRDVPVPMEYDHIPLYKALKKAYPDDVEEFVVDDDHFYSSTRIAVTRAVLAWLKRQGF